MDTQHITTMKPKTKEITPAPQPVQQQAPAPQQRQKKPKDYVIKNKLPQLLTLVVAGRGIELPARGERTFPADTKLGPDVALKLRRKMITVCQ